MYMGAVTASSKFGGGFSIPTRDSISLGIVAGIEDLAHQEPHIKAPELLDAFKQRQKLLNSSRAEKRRNIPLMSSPKVGQDHASAVQGTAYWWQEMPPGFYEYRYHRTRNGIPVATGYYAARAVVRPGQETSVPLAWRSTKPCSMTVL